MNAFVPQKLGDLQAGPGCLRAREHDAECVAESAESWSSHDEQRLHERLERRACLEVELLEESHRLPDGLGDGDSLLGGERLQLGQLAAGEKVGKEGLRLAGAGEDQTKTTIRRASVWPRLEDGERTRIRFGRRRRRRQLQS